MADGREIARHSGAKALNRPRSHSEHADVPRTHVLHVELLAIVVEISVIFSGGLNVLGIFWRF